MIEEGAVVVATEAGLADLEVVRRSACGACSAQSACGVSLLDRMLGRRPQRLLVRNHLGVRIGERVIVGVPEAALVRAALAAYLLPLAGLLAGGVVGAAIGGGPAAAAVVTPAGELPALFGGIAGFALGLWLLGVYSRRLGADPTYRTVLLRRATDAPGAVSVALPQRPG